MFAWFAWTLMLLGPIHLKNNRPFLHIFSSARVSNSLRGHFHPSPTFTRTLSMGRRRGLPEGGRPLLSDSRTVTADTFFAHLLTLRMFRVYVFMSISQNPDTWRKLPDILFFLFVFFIEVFPWTDIILYLDVLVFFLWFFCSDFCIVLTVTPAWIQGNVKGVIGHFAWRKKITFTYFAFTTAKNN